MLRFLYSRLCMHVSDAAVSQLLRSIPAIFISHTCRCLYYGDMVSLGRGACPSDKLTIHDVFRYAISSSVGVTKPPQTSLALVVSTCRCMTHVPGPVCLLQSPPRIYAKDALKTTKIKTSQSLLLCMLTKPHSQRSVLRTHAW